MGEQENEGLTAGGPRGDAGPYTDPGNEEPDTLNGQVAATIRGLDRKLTDGLNLVHGQLDVMRHERLEDRRELRETRAELKAAVTAVEQKFESRCDGMEKKSEGRFDALEQKFESRFASLEGAIRELTALTSTALERSLGTRRLVRSVLGAVALLLAGGLLRPVFERAVQALLGG